jgi:3-hydroxyacyl-[acyl-carrier-protein] dehydratase
MEIDLKEIKELIPHRYPFLLVDKIKDVKIGESATGIKNVCVNEWYFQGHFPDHPVLPGVLIVEAMAQTAATLVAKTIKTENRQEKSDSHLVYFMSVESAKFRKPVVPSDVIELKVLKQQSRSNIWKFKGDAFVDNKIVAEATFTAMIVTK